MTSESFDQRIQAARQRMETLAERAKRPTNEQGLMLETLEDLSSAMEELHVAAEELRQQNEELAATRQIVEAERQRYQDLFEFAPDAYLVTDHEGTIQEGNSAAASLLGVRPEFLLGKPLAVFVLDGDRPTFRDRLTRMQEANQTIEDWQLNLQPRERIPFPASVTIGVMRDAAGRLTGLRWLIRDITERRRAEELLRGSREQLRALAGHLELVRDQERAAAAKEVHDELGQALVGVKLKLASLAAQLPKPTWQAEANDMLALINTMLKVSLRISEGLHSSPLDVLGLMPAIQAEGRAFQARTGIACQVNADGVHFPLNRTQASTFFRICQESLVNVADHAKATQVTIRMQKEADQLILTVADNGRGITEQEIDSGGSLGLLQMREQALSQGGELSIVGRPGAGTTVTVRMPFKAS
jgi:PAS domain S-box-containing protein